MSAKGIREGRGIQSAEVITGSESLQSMGTPLKLYKMEFSLGTRLS